MGPDSQLINKTALFLLFWLLSFHLAADVRVQDDTGQTLSLPQAAVRIISLSPHITELLYAAGVTEQLIGTVSFSDYPAAAKLVPQVGEYNKFDFETIISLNPDLIIAWQSGNPKDQVDRLRQLGFRVFLSEPHSLQSVANSIRTFGKLLGTSDMANIEASKYEARLNKLKASQSGKSGVRVFYQVWDRPLMTVNGKHIISDVIRFCGGRNIFEDLPLLSPHVDIEAILERNPDLIVAGMAQGRENWLQDWQQWAQLSAVKNKQLYSINADLITRHSPRLLHGAETMCEHLDQFRALIEK